LVQEDVRQLLRGAVAAAIEQEQRFGGVGQRDQERVRAVAIVDVPTIEIIDGMVSMG
jgi:hypothetical protein